MTDALHNFNQECQEQLLQFKTLLFSQTSISETNKSATPEEAIIHSVLVDKLESTLSLKLLLYPKEDHKALNDMGNYYIIQFVSLVDFPNPS